VQLYNGDYSQILSIGVLPSQTILYCDPPYANTTKYSTSFNSNKFWEWCDDMISYGYKVYVSEYNAPDSWECIYEKMVVSSLDLNTGNKTNTERLFTKIKPQPSSRDCGL